MSEMNWCGYYGEYVSQMKVFVEHSSLGVVLLKKTDFLKSTIISVRS
jgi:hypothetical protein